MNTELELGKVKMRQRFLELEEVALKAAIEMAEFGIDHDIKREGMLAGIEGLKDQLKNNAGLQVLGSIAISLGSQIIEQEAKEGKS